MCGPSAGFSREAMELLHNFSTPNWSILIRKDRIKIGCKEFNLNEIFEMDEISINKIHRQALKWWLKVKKPLYEFCVAAGYLKNEGEAITDDLTIGMDW